MSKRKTHEEFLEELYLNNEGYRAGDFSVKETYKSINEKILLGTSCGDVMVRCGHLLNNLKFTIESAVDKNEFARNRIKNVHGDIFDLSKVNYTRSRDNIIIGCKKHGFVEVQFNNLIQNRGCPKCGRDLLKEQVKSNGGWSYSEWEKQGSSSINFESFKVYIIRCWKNNEEFYKIGKTFTTVNERMKGVEPNSAMPYFWEVVKTYPLESARAICEFERELIKTHSSFSYIPKNKFPGYRECFSRLIF